MDKVKTSTIIELQDVSTNYNKEKMVLRNINLTIKKDDFLGIIGPNGGGKTTLVKTILGLKKPSSGKVIYYRDGQIAPNIKMGYLPQYNKIDKQFPISVHETILSGLSTHLWQKYTTAMHDQVHELACHFGLEPYEQKPIGELSGGQVQRALLARAVISDPDVVILDEPNTYIDKKFEAHLYHLLEEINQTKAIVLVSHDLGSVMQNVKSIACVNETLDYHPDTEIPEGWIEERFDCPIDLIGHSNHPHRVLKSHNHG